MAQKVNIVLLDDLDGTEAEQTVRFGFDGVDYEIDLNDKHSKALSRALMPYVEKARKVKGGHKVPRLSSVQSGPRPADVRAWAAANNIEVNPRGRIPGEIVAQYEAAQSA